MTFLKDMKPCIYRPFEAIDRRGTDTRVRFPSPALICEPMSFPIPTPDRLPNFRIAPRFEVKPGAPLTHQPFSSVLLAGGNSTRMGEDKAGIVIAGQRLWQRQLSILRGLDPAEIFISGRRDGPYTGEGIEVIFDVHPGAGPLAGVQAALVRAKTPWLVVLAIDLPDMNTGFLAGLLTLAFERERGIIPFDGKWFEPLAAVYCRAMLELVTECLRGEDHSMQHFANQAMKRGLAESYPLSSVELDLMRNVNEPADLSRDPQIPV